MEEGWIRGVGLDCVVELKSLSLVESLAYTVANFERVEESGPLSYSHIYVHVYKFKKHFRVSVGLLL